MGFKDADCVWPGKKEHGSSFWISIKHNPGTHNAPSPSCAKVYTSERKGKPAPGLHLTPVAKALQAKAINSRRNVMLSQILFQTMQSLVSFSISLLPDAALRDIKNSSTFTGKEKSVCSLLSPLPQKMWKMASSSESSKTRRPREQMHIWLLFLNLTIFQTPLFCFWGIWLIIFRSKQEALQTSPSISSLHPPTHPSCLLHNFWKL